jgi:hypothetical protein
LQRCSSVSPQAQHHFAGRVALSIKLIDAVATNIEKLAVCFTKMHGGADVRDELAAVRTHEAVDTRFVAQQGLVESLKMGSSMIDDPARVPPRFIPRTNRRHRRRFAPLLGTG